MVKLDISNSSHDKVEILFYLKKNCLCDMLLEQYNRKLYYLLFQQSNLCCAHQIQDFRLISNVIK